MKLLECIAHIANRSSNQQSFLLELCDYDIDKYILLEACLHKNYPSYIPADKQSLEFILANDVKVSELGDKDTNTLTFKQLFRTQSTYLYYRTLENFVLQKIKDIELEIKVLEEFKKDYSDKDYLIMSNRLGAQKEVLYMCLTGHTNTYKRK